MIFKTISLLNNLRPLSIAMNNFSQGNARSVQSDVVPQELDVTIMCHNPTSQDDASSKEMSQDVSVFPRAGTS